MSGSPPDPSRRRFFRQFAGEVVASAAQVVGAVAEVRDRSAAEAQALLGTVEEAVGGHSSAPRSGRNDPDAVHGAPDRALGGGPPSGFRTPFRFDAEETLLVIDQRALPDELVEIPVRNAHDGARVIREMAVRGAPAIGQVAALSLALSGWLARNAPPRSRDAILRSAATHLADARPTAANLGWAVGRVMAAYDAAAGAAHDAPAGAAHDAPAGAAHDAPAGAAQDAPAGAAQDAPAGAAHLGAGAGAGASGPRIAAAMRAEADRIVFEATDDHGRLAEHGVEALPDVGDRELRLLTHGNTGPLACGQFGTALGVIQVAHHGERPLHVWVDETRPYLHGARLTAWELAQAGVPHTLIPDVAAASLVAGGQVDAILVGADRVAANGDVANEVGTYPLAVLAARHGIPFYVCAPISSVDLDTHDGAAIPVERWAPEEVTQIRGRRIAPAGTAAWNPAFDVTPAELLAAIVTEEGLLRPPFGPALRAAAEARARRRSLTTAVAAEAFATASVLGASSGPGAFERATGEPESALG